MAHSSGAQKAFGVVCKACNYCENRTQLNWEAQDRCAFGGLLVLDLAWSMQDGV